MKKLFATALLLTLFVGVTFAQNPNSPGEASGRGILYDAAVTSTNDTFQTSWYNIGDASEVFLGISVSDSALLKFTVDYRSGGSSVDEYASFTDSLFTNSATGAYLPYQLKGFMGNAESAAAQDTAIGYINRIPAANHIRLNVFRHTDNNDKVNATTYSIQARLIFKK
jgi:hypothetical protein